MNRLLTFLAVACMVLGVFLVCASSIPGVVVPDDETTNLMGSKCYDWTPTPIYLCYGGNCMTGGCGCRRIYDTIDHGSYSPILPTEVEHGAGTPCQDSGECTSAYTDLGGTCIDDY